MNNRDVLQGIFVPGHIVSQLEIAFRMATPGIMIDLVNLVPEEDLHAARYLVKEALNEFSSSHKHISIFIHSPQTHQGKETITLLTDEKIDILRLGQINSPDHIQNIEYLIKTSWEKNNMPGIELVVNNLSTFRNLEAICNTSTLVTTLTISGQLREELAKQSDLDFDKVKKSIIEQAQRLKLTALDSINTNYRNLDTFRQDCINSKHMGFQGRYVIHPSQIKICMEIYKGV